MYSHQNRRSQDDSLLPAVLEKSNRNFSSNFWHDASAYPTMKENQKSSYHPSLLYVLPSALCRNPDSRLLLLIRMSSGCHVVQMMDQRRKAIVCDMRFRRAALISAGTSRCHRHYPTNLRHFIPIIRARDLRFFKLIPDASTNSYQVRHQISACHPAYAVQIMTHFPLPVLSESFLPCTQSHPP